MCKKSRKEYLMSIQKRYNSSEKSEIIKKYDKPRTPLERLLQSNETDEEIKKVLRLQFKKLNPYKIEKQIREKIRNIFALLRR